MFIYFWFSVISLIIINAGSVTNTPTVGGSPSMTGQDVLNQMVLTTQLKMVDTLVYSKKYKTAIKRLRNLEQQYPQNADIENYFGYAYRKLNQLGKSAMHYQNALRINPMHLGALEYQGELYILYKQYDKAKENLAKLKRLCGTNCEEYQELKKALTN
tara:strand:+ start:1088 stop:1561 length:474 start_codon:yes stop_codon:yes gene_type:complete